MLPWVSATIRSSGWDELPFRQFTAAQNVADLRAVAVRDDDAPAFGDHAGDMLTGDAHGFPLIDNFGVFGVLNEGIAANGDSSEFANHKVYVLR